MARASLFPARDRVHFLDARDDVPSVIRDADVLVRAALTEGLPNVALEAMAMRVPVVATGICGTRKLCWMGRPVGSIRPATRGRSPKRSPSS